MSDPRLVPVPAVARPRALAPALALALTVGMASLAPSLTLPLRLAATAGGALLEADALPQGRAEALDLGADPAALGAVGTTSPDPSRPPAVPAANPPPMPSLAAFPSQVGRDFTHLITRPLAFDTRDWTRLAIGAGAVGVVALFDNRIHNAVYGGTSSGATRFAKSIRPLGTWGGVAIMGATLAAGGLFHDSNLAATGLDGLEAALFTGVVIVPLLKEVSGRSRPISGQGPSHLDSIDGGRSFPSGEVAMAFTEAAVVSQHTESPVVRGLAWGLAGLVGWERMRLDAHWASDVAAGALIGTAVGSWVAKIHRPEETKSNTSVSMMPLVGPQGVGLAASISW